MYNKYAKNSIFNGKMNNNKMDPSIVMNIIGNIKTKDATAKVCKQIINRNTGYNSVLCAPAFVFAMAH